MSVANAIQKGDFDLNLVSLRKPLEFPDGTIQDTAYTGGGGIPTLEEVLLAGDDAQGSSIVGLDDLTLTGQIIQNALVGFNGNELDPTIITTDVGATNAFSFGVLETTNNSSFKIVPRSQDNIFNPMVQPDDICLVANSNVSSLTITSDSATTNGIRMSDTQMVIGVGGNADTPSTNFTFNNPAGTIFATTTAGFQVNSSTIEPTPTLKVADVPSGQSTYFIPKANAGNYNPICQANNQQIVAWGTAGINTQTIELVPHSATACGIKLAPTTCEIGAGGGGADPSNRITFSSAGTLEYGNSHQFVNGVAQYSPAGNASGIIPSAPSTASNVIPSFEILSYHLTGNASTSSDTMVLQHNITGTTNYAVFPSIYYGYSGSGGTYNAGATSSACGQIVINGITSTQFTWFLSKNTGDNVNIYLQFLVVYQMPNTDYPKNY